MRIDPKEYDIEVLDVEGQWCGLDDVVNIEYKVTTTVVLGGDPIRRTIDSIAIDYIDDGQLMAMVCKPDRVNLTRR